jgi:transcriptional regulator with XRE-family HTH domain
MSRRSSVIDAQIGRRIALRRRQLKKSQTELGKALGISFQQIQKYEKGKNRIPSGRLVQIAQALDVPVAWFFEQPVASSTLDETTADAKRLEAFLNSREGVRLALVFSSIVDPQARRRIADAILRLIEGITESKRQ